MSHLRLCDAYLSQRMLPDFLLFLSAMVWSDSLLPELNADLSLTFSVCLGKQKVWEMNKANAQKGNINRFERGGSLCSSQWFLHHWHTPRFSGCFCGHAIAALLVCPSLTQIRASVFLYQFGKYSTFRVRLVRDWFYNWTFEIIWSMSWWGMPQSIWWLLQPTSLR